MASEILIDARSNSKATEIMNAIAAQELWGVALGTTTVGTEYANYIRIECTDNRANELLSVVPTDEVDFLVLNCNIFAFSSDDVEDSQRLWYLRGVAAE
tara:strand:+ start:400 stop:696 length:297 start_codon:yes stop_codon:yes gene_type:complete